MKGSGRTFGQLTVALLFGLLSVAFLLRAFFYGFRWLSRAVAGTANFKVMTVWSLLYFAVCAAIAWVALRKTPEDHDTVAGLDRGS